MEESTVFPEGAPPIHDPSPQEHQYKFNVKMTCGGCSGAVTRVLDKAKKEGDVSDFTVTLETQEVLVTGTLPYEEVYEKIRKTGKEIRSGETLVPSPETVPSPE